MPGANAQYFGGKRRIYYSAAPDAGQAMTTWGTAAQTINRTLNPIDGSDLIGSPNQILLPHANQARGQDFAPSSLIAGAEATTATLRFPLTPEAFGKFAASAWGADTKSAHGTGYQHALTLTDEPVCFTIEEHLQGMTDTTNSWKYAGTWCNAFTIEVSPGQQYATLSPSIVCSKWISAGGDQTTYDNGTYWPDEPGMPPTKLGLWVAPTSSHTTAYDGAITVPTVAGVLNEDLTGQIAVGQIASSWSFSFDSGVNLDDLYVCGSSGSTGWYRGKPYMPQPSCRITLNYAVNSDTDALISYFTSWNNSVQKSYTAQLYGVTDNTVGGAGYYGGLSIVVNAMYLAGPVKFSSDLGPLTATVELIGMQAASSAAYLLGWAWDDVNQDYA